MARRPFAMLVVALVGTGFALVGEAQPQTTSTTSQTVQTPPPTTSVAPAMPVATPPRPVTPEQQALTAAGALKDPASKLQALKKIRTDFPKTISAHNQADSLMLTLLVDTWPERTDEIAEVFERVIKATPAATGEARLSLLQRPVTQLVDKKILLDRAEAALDAALAGFDAIKFMESQIDLMKRVKQPEPTASALISRYHAARGRGLELLGRIYVEKGDSRAEATLKSALAGNPSSPTITLQLAGLEVKRGDESAALDHYLIAALGSKLKPADNAAMMSLFHKLRGSGAGLEDELDKVYRTALPNPVKPEKWTPTPNRSTRLVLAEAFTGSACAPCVSESLAFQALLERYPEDAVAALAYHVHIPGPDPMTTSGSVGRKEYYTVRGVPTFNVDGALSRLGGGGRDNTSMVYDAYVKSIDKALETPALAAVSIAASVNGEKIAVKTSFSKIASDAKDLRLHVVLAEHVLRFSGENGIRFHEMVVRAVAGEKGAGLPVAGTADATIEHTFDLAAIRADITESLAAEIARRRKTDASAATAAATPREYRAQGRAMTELDPNTLVVIAFLQDGQKKVLQAARVDVSGTHAPRVK